MTDQVNQHSAPVSLVIQAAKGATLEDVKREAAQWAEQLGCDVVFIMAGRVYNVRPASFSETESVTG